jgi:GT2 family glycosyltransferase
VAEKIDLSVIILNYNTRDFLRQCLQSIKKTQGIDPEVIVVDNASTDGSVAMVKENFPEVKLMVNEKNIGFAAGNNQGVKKAKGKFILFLNPDTLVQPETLKAMVDYLKKHPKTGAATCQVELPNGQLDYACHRGFPTPWNAFAYFSGLAKLFPKIKAFTGYTLSYLPLNQTHPIDAACGAFLMVRREAGEASHWWDEDYFWYGEDLDFCYRLKQKGWRIDYVSQTKIIHHKGAASGIKKHSQKIATATKKTKKRAIKASTEVMRVFFQKHYRDKYPKPIYWLVMKGIDLLEKYRLWRHAR